MARAGRKPKLNVKRSPKGKSRGEPEVIDARVLFFRVRDLKRDGIESEYAKDPLAGFSLGRLLLRWRQDNSNPGAINPSQFAAGEEWCRIVNQHAAVMGYKLGSPSPSFVMVSNGLSCSDGPDEASILYVRRRFSECYDAIMETCRLDRAGLAIRNVLYAICIENRSLGTLSPAEYGNLRVGLNALANVLTRGRKSVLGAAK